jgi:nitroreductase
MAWVDTIPTFTSTVDLFLQYVGFATQNMWLVGHKYGIGAGYNGMPLLDVRRRETISEHLGIPWSWEPTGAFCFGQAKGPRYFGPARPPLEGVTFSEYWGNPYRRMALTEKGYQTMQLPASEIEETIANLNFVESFEGGAVPPWMIEKVLDTALWGPVPENFKNWRFMVIRDAASKEFLRGLVSEKKYCPWTYAWPELQHARAAGVVEEERLAAVERALEKDLGAWITEADTLILVLSCVFNWRDQPYPGLAAGPNHMFAISTGCCTQNMFIAASALGLGVAYDVLASGDERTRELMNDYFGIPATTWVPLGILGLGRPGKKATPPALSLGPLVYEEHWGNPYPIKTT